MRIYRTSSMQEIHKIRVGKNITCELTDICRPQFFNPLQFTRNKMIIKVWYRKKNKHILLCETGYQYQNGKLRNKGIVDFQYVSNLQMQLEHLCQHNILSQQDIKNINRDMINDACMMALVVWLGI